MSRFERVLAEEIDGLKNLPLLHTCDAYRFRNILEEMILKPSLCDVFNTDLLYTYYGLPSYRVQLNKATNNPAHYMVCFILNSEDKSAFAKVYPFDSGAFCKLNEIKEKFFHEETKIDDFELTGSIISAKKVIKTFYNTNDNYLNQTPSLTKELSQLDFEAHGYNNLISDNSSSRIDDRASSIEVLFDTGFNLDKSSVNQIIIPKCFRDDEYAMKLVKENLGIENPLTYNTHRGNPSEFFGLLRQEYFKFLKN
ncbi:hypothetical protein DI487_10310 [Flavobacterium sediminis]|uniref:Uncharacterized protein n=1 Tax=Flavobacterium sediminis TaxID=2201181 RepID=A0A2U8QWN3_9FLAO|nr:hypothetical protein [Flavobacterium sediminis]AWM14205.1 hypothetical protein DI487_10310 [Flavobacterium sediminis]